MEFDTKKFRENACPLLNSYCLNLKSLGVSPYTPRSSTDKACASLNIKRSVSASGFSPGLGWIIGSIFHWTRVRGGNHLKNWSESVTAIGRIGRTTRFNRQSGSSRFRNAQSLPFFVMWMNPRRCERRYAHWKSLGKVDYTYEKSSVHKWGLCCTDKNTRRMKWTLS